MVRLAILFVALCAIAAAASTSTHKRKSRTRHVVHRTTTRAVKRSSRAVPPRANTATRQLTEPGVQQHVPAVQQGRGPSSERYKEIQQALAKRGYYQGEVNGQWNPESAAALQRFQSEQNLRADGRLSSLSLIALGLGPKRTTAQTQPHSVPAPGVSQ